MSKLRSIMGPPGVTLPDVPPAHEQALLLDMWRAANAGRRVELLRDKRSGELTLLETTKRTASEYAGYGEE